MPNMHKYLLLALLSVSVSSTAYAQGLGFLNFGVQEEDTEEGAIEAAPSDETTGERVAPNYEDFLADQTKPENLHEDNFTLRIRVLERYTDSTQDFAIKAHSSVIYRNTLLIRAESCVTDFNEIPSNDGGFITVENREGEQLYKGWMFASMPSLTIFEHPDYDILVRGCDVQ